MSIIRKMKPTTEPSTSEAFAPNHRREETQQTMQSERNRITAQTENLLSDINN